MPERYVEKILPDGRTFKNIPINKDLPKVLLVDDEKIFVSSMVDILRRRGFQTKGLVVQYTPSERKIIEQVATIAINANRSDISIIDYGLGCIDVRLILDQISDRVKLIILSGAAVGVSGYQEFDQKKIRVVEKPIEDFQSFIDDLTKM